MAVELNHETPSRVGKVGLRKKIRIKPNFQISLVYFSNIKLQFKNKDQIYFHLNWQDQ